VLGDAERQQVPSRRRESRVANSPRHALDPKGLRRTHCPSGPRCRTSELSPRVSLHHTTMASVSRGEGTAERVTRRSTEGVGVL